MPDYKIFYFENGRIVNARIISADDDEAAIDQARELVGEKTAELWHETEKIHLFNPVL
jgi:hypothetical protein